MERWRPALYAAGIAGALLLVVLTWPGGFGRSGPGGSGDSARPAGTAFPVFIYATEDGRVLIDDPDAQGWVAISADQVAHTLVRLGAHGNLGPGGGRPVEIIAEAGAPRPLLETVLDQARAARAPLVTVAPIRTADPATARASEETP